MIENNYIKHLSLIYMSANARVLRKGVSICRNTLIKKSSQRYKDHVTQDNQLFLNMKIEGESIESRQLIQILRHKKKQQRTAKSLSIQKRQSNLLYFKVKKQTSTSISNKLDLKSISQQQKNENKKKERKCRSKTIECERKYERKENKNQDTNSINPLKDEKVETSYPKLAYKQIRLDEQLSCNFKQVICEFNKTKKQITRRIEQSQQKNQQKNHQKMARKTFGNPNFCQFQQFVRQNYHVKHMRGTLNSFQNNYMSIGDSTKHTNGSKRCITQIQHNKKQRHLNFSQQKKMVVYIHEDKNSVEATDKKQRKDKTQPFLQIKRHQFSHTQRVATQMPEQKERQKPKIVRMNKTSNLQNFFKHNYEIAKQQDKIQPWNTSDHTHFCY